MNQKITYSRSNAYSIVLAALLLARNPASDVKVNKKHSVSDTDIEENKKLISNNHVLHLVSDSALDSEENEKGGHIAYAIIALHGDLNDPANVQLLSETNNSDLRIVRQLEDEGKLLVKYEEFKKEFAGEDATEDIKKSKKNKNKAPTKHKESDKKIKLGSDKPATGPEQNMEPLTGSGKQIGDAPEQHMAPIVGSAEDGQHSTDLGNEVPGENETNINDEPGAPAAEGENETN